MFSSVTDGRTDIGSRNCGNIYHACITKVRRSHDDDDDGDDGGGGEKENLFAKKVDTIIIQRITKYNGRLPERVLTPSKLAAYVSLNNQIESNNEKETKKVMIMMPRQLLSAPAKMKATSPKSQLKSQKTIHEKTMCPTNDWTFCTLSGCC